MIQSSIESVQPEPKLNSEQKPMVIPSAQVSANAMLVAAFPGTGKTYFFNRSYTGIVLDSDSSLFHKDDFPNNYIRHIKACQNTATIILISSHKVVRDALVRESLPFTLVYPKEQLKDEYLERYRKRGSTEQFISMMNNNWSSWLFDCHRQIGCTHIELESGQFLSDVIGCLQRLSALRWAGLLWFVSQYKSCVELLMMKIRTKVD